MTLSLQVFLAFIATACFAYSFNAPKRELIICGVTGAIGFLFYLITNKYTVSVSASNFIGAFALAYASRSFAFIRKIPFTVFLTPAIIPLVPGLMVYQTVFNLISENYTASVSYGIDCARVVGAIVTGIVVSLTLPRWLILFHTKPEYNK